MHFHEKLRLARESAGISRRELAGMAGVSASLIRDFENGDRTNIGIDSLSALAVSLGLTIIVHPADDKCGQIEA